MRPGPEGCAMTHIATTQYGFEYGAAEVIRACSHKGYVVITVAAKCGAVDLIVTPKGNRIRIVDRTRKTGRR
jgi:hypothetical protein